MSSKSEAAGSVAAGSPQKPATISDFGGVANRWMIFAAVLAASLVFNTCAKDVAFKKSTVAPAATARAQLDRDQNGNVTVSLEVTDGMVG